MRAGELRHQITLQSPSKTQNTFGEEVITYSTAATAWAHIETLSESEYLDQQRAGASLTHKVTIRNRSDVEPTWRVVWDARTFEISAVLSDNLGREMTLMCSEVVSG